jgi:hypothetical protein
VAGEGKSERRRQVARLIRGEESRTPGTKKWYAGNGGRLEMCLRHSEARAEEDTEDRWDEGLTEVVVVVTALVMLKKEIDRMRSRKMAAAGR